MLPAMKEFSCYTFFDATDGGGHLLEVEAPPGDKDKIIEALKLAKSIREPRKDNNIQHGGYGRYTRFRFTQHKYAGGGCGYIEALEIHKPPDGRHGIVLCEYSGRYPGDTFFWEFDTVKNLVSAWEREWGADPRKRDMKKHPGFIREVNCGHFDPWFYACGDQHLKGDFVFPDLFAEHPIFRVFRTFVIYDYEGVPEIKVCVGCHSYEAENRDWMGHSSGGKIKRLKIYWDDATFSDLSEAEALSTSSSGARIVPLEGGELWIKEAIDKFRQLLAENIDNFEIPLAGSKKFFGKLVPRKFDPKGTYCVHFKYTVNGKEKSISQELPFTPTKEVPTVEAWIKKDATTQAEKKKVTLVLGKINITKKTKRKG